LKVLLTGCNGNMGRMVHEVIAETDGMEIVAGVDALSQKSDGYPVFPNYEECNVDADVIIDFTHFSVVPELLDYAFKTKTPVVICTTGLDEDALAKIDKYAKSISIFRSGNMSLGINLLIDLVKKAASILGSAYDVEIIEKHHNKKVDSPSGTAYMIAEEINEEFNNSKDYVYGRYGNDTKRDKNEIGIHAVRGGTIVGEHSVIFAGADEVIEVKHNANSKKVFAQGAVKAAEFLATKENGLYDMNDIFK